MNKYQLFVLSLASCFFTTEASTQVLPDATLPVNSTVNQLGNTTIIEGGTRIGGNLFHSFGEFSVPTDNSAYFNNGLEIQNIISRITGNNPSNIDGIIRTNGSANLFLLNPKGIIFGPNARLNIGGSFIATTANSLQFADGTEFSASNQKAPLLTLSVPIGLQFNNPSPIAVQGSNLFAETGKTLALVGGDVTIFGSNDPAYRGLQAGGFPLVVVEGNQLPTTPGGRIELGSVINGNVSLSATEKGFALSYQNASELGNIQLSDRANIDSIGTGGGEIQVVGRSLKITAGSRIASMTFGDIPGGNITVKATEFVELIGTGELVEFLDKFLSFKTRPDEFRNGLFNLSFGSGNAGDITIDTGRFRAQNAAFAISSTARNGKGGNLNLNARESVELNASGLFAATRPESTGTAGNITINTRHLLLRDLALATTSTTGSGKGGTLTVNATESVELIGSTPYPIFDGEANTVISTGSFSSGEAGDLKINTARLTIRNGAYILADADASGRSGTVEINASEKVELIGQYPQGELASGISSQSRGTGNAGDIRIVTSSLILSNLAVLSVDSFSTGRAGNLEVTADSVQLDNFSALQATTKAGDRGNITLNTGSLQIRGNSAITTDASGSANGGNITINTNTLVVLDNSAIVANAIRGQGGNIQIETQSIFLSPESTIAASSQYGVSGTVDVRLPNTNVQNIVPLSSNLMLPDTVLALSCSPRQNANSNFTVTGTGGLPTTPYDAIGGRYEVARVQGIGRIEGKNSSSSIRNAQSAAIQEAQAIVRVNGETLLVTGEQLREIINAENLICQRS